ncbi:hypothetical protein GUJ93_ZPchr0393g29140 [Zizania palustris]|uniref:Probable magnesium transporter n=1 Tax=Zizania palustris TaxID=103762 RepID=A0A8J5VHD0_ZIZPA|nr:hypothetical protein GUJ93_ZPchr0393g29140 [Zizania palustris]
MGGARLGMRWVEGMSADNVKACCCGLLQPLHRRQLHRQEEGLKKAGASGVRAGVGGYSYLLEPLWWAGMTANSQLVRLMLFAPAILVTPLGALSIIISAVLAHIILREKLHIFGILGCILCVVGSTSIVLHAPPEREIESVAEVWDLATEPAFLLYASIVLAAAFVLIFHFVPQYGQTHHGVHWCLFSCGILIGHECKSSWNSLEADIFRDEPACLSTDMDVFTCGSCMHSNTDELSEQGP